MIHLDEVRAKRRSASDTSSLLTSVESDEFQDSENAANGALDKKRGFSSSDATSSLVTEITLSQNGDNCVGNSSPKIIKNSISRRLKNELNMKSP